MTTDECPGCHGTGWVPSTNVPGLRRKCETCGGDGIDHWLEDMEDWIRGHLVSHGEDNNDRK